ncbi:unnamed protein product [Cuscuta campestris]|uniref:Fungal lipase-type domain-containing protein n=1 Tax=Cuscuta campestris TaxID=132261 RepID=A0A484KAD4_9ASTE|nr:unnamed protein product [Cuscuta campestris]
MQQTNQPSTPALPGINRLLAAAKCRLPPVKINQNDTIQILTNKASTGAAKFAETMSEVLNNLNNIPKSNQEQNILSIGDMADTPAMSPRDNISSLWRDIQGCREWEGLLDPLHPWLRREIVKYGEFAQATYDAFDLDLYSEYYGSCLYACDEMFQKVGIVRNGYEVVSYIYAMSSPQLDVPEWLEGSTLAHAWSKDSNWIGYVAASNEEETRRIGRRDVVVAWRGTVTPSEWSENMQNKLEAIGHGDAKVEHGFLSIYTSKCDTSRFNKKSASEQVMDVLGKLVDFYTSKGEEVSVTVTGHSLGGALAVLNAYEAAVHFPGVPVTVISFAAPRVGNIAFRDEVCYYQGNEEKKRVVYQKGVKTLRVTVKQDLVPKWPGVVFNEGLQKYDDLIGPLEWVYTHIGVELKLDARSSPYLRGGMNLFGCHMLETYLHLVDGYCSSRVPFREDAKRDVALVNKDCDMLVDELRVPPNWYQLGNKGLELNSCGRWVRRKRVLEDEAPSFPSHLLVSKEDGFIEK